MKVNNTRTWYECTDGNGGWSYPTQLEATQQLADMWSGFPSSKHMSEENREYWKRAAMRYYIIEVTKTEKRLKL